MLKDKMHANIDTKCELNVEKEKAILYLYGAVVSDSFFNNKNYITTEKVQAFLEEAKAEKKELEIHLNSPGGEVFAGVAIYNMIKSYEYKTVTIIDGIAASIASVIAMAGDEVIMGEGSVLMIHNPYTLAVGNSQELRKTAEDLDTITESIKGIYKNRFKGTDAELQALLDAETFLSADDAITLKFADRKAEKITKKESGNESAKASAEENAKINAKTDAKTEEIKKSIIEKYQNKIAKNNLKNELKHFKKHIK